MKISIVALVLATMSPVFSGRRWYQRKEGRTNARASEMKVSSNINNNDATYRVVVDMSGDSLEKWAGILRNVDNLRAALGSQNVAVEVVVYGKALPAVEGNIGGNDNPLAEQAQFLSDGGVLFKACENSMRRMELTREMLLPFVTTVDSGVAALVRRQYEGWAYLKPGP